MKAFAKPREATDVFICAPCKSRSYRGYGMKPLGRCGSPPEARVSIVTAQAGQVEVFPPLDFPAHYPAEVEEKHKGSSCAYSTARPRIRRPRPFKLLVATSGEPCYASLEECRSSPRFPRTDSFAFSEERRDSQRRASLKVYTYRMSHTTA